MHIRVVVVYGDSDVSDVKGEIAFLGSLLYFKGLAQGFYDVCFERIDSWFSGIWKKKIYFIK